MSWLQFSIGSSLLACLSSHVMMSSKTFSMLSSGSPDVKPCHIPGYNLIVLSLLLALSYNALLTSGSVTVSVSPCNTKNGKLTLYKVSSRFMLVLNISSAVFNLGLSWYINLFFLICNHCQRRSCIK
ncbi:hypothetical protein MtrunA17_Chr7g0269381 [Medicago truncatula]|uniref:Transmembrane protein n=1 Tax=Medicago truncatula TaxID=3880 RepID=A0A396H6S4_MEDTR|nr:hypothetical protein MtrunA17_Chr7g0269381 [Medicago truncatula]